ncbi:efflux RND transporter periplasmic adaptor subunit [Litorilituus sediminis]|uniref:Efflux RND transporter periplasmic adaptor subunit n=1 Tax=Litorilituus sediminis TaxID=718192 RepID=A0A4P6P4U9_9GAMM|nr:efflux RND transporter periplasmic adaptor subunit [Litorilituus sediminis]QBG36581.1 efflux RND transporter periplasmic adaptor subunit [Litorilituus sediminis]
MTKFTLNMRWLEQRPYIIAIIIALTLVLWMASGSNATAKDADSNGQESKEAVKAQVKVETHHAQDVFRTVELYGRTEPDRVTTLKAEVRGKIVEVSAKRGSRVEKGQIIAQIALNDLPSQLTRSKALLKQREIEYQGVLKLNEKGYQGRVQLAQAFADLEAVKAEIERLELDIANTVIRAPFSGVLNTRYVEVGDYVASGDDIAMIADLDPLIVRAHVTENQINLLSIGQKAQVSLLNKQTAQGELRYIASVGNDATNTFKIEVAIENKDSKLLAGLSSELTIALEKIPAIKVSPALLALDELGNIGVKSVDNNRVTFTPIDIVKSESDGVWLTGLGNQSDIITLGQGFVRHGDKVEAIFADDKQPKSSAASDASTASSNL